MSQDPATAAYELVFEGPADESTRTMQRLKGVFIADLEFSVEEVQHFLTSTSVVIKRGDSEAELSREERLIRAAGGKVLIVRRAESEATPEAPQQVEELLDLGLDGTPTQLQTVKETESPKTPHAEPQTGGLELSFEAAPVVAKQAPKDSHPESDKKPETKATALAFELDAEAPAVAASSSAKSQPVSKAPPLEKMASATQLASITENLEGLGLDPDEVPSNISPKATTGSLSLDLTLAPAIETDPEKLHQSSVTAPKEEWELPSTNKPEAASAPAAKSAAPVTKQLAPQSSNPLTSAAKADTTQHSFEMLSDAPKEEIIRAESKPSPKLEKKPAAAVPKETEAQTSEREESLAKLLAKRAAQPPLAAPSAEPESGPEVLISAPIDDSTNLWRELGVPIVIGALVLLALHLGNYFVEPEAAPAKPGAKKEMPAVGMPTAE
jgi:hypothetical protein